jgi:hypothetical protein
MYSRFVQFLVEDLRSAGDGKHAEIHKGKRYRAVISLGLLESLAGNDRVAQQIADAGFTEVEVRGGGREREAEALWPLDDASAEIPRQVSDIVEIA